MWETRHYSALGVKERGVSFSSPSGYTYACRIGSVGLCLARAEWLVGKEEKKSVILYSIRERGRGGGNLHAEEEEEKSYGLRRGKGCSVGANNNDKVVPVLTVCT